MKQNKKINCAERINKYKKGIERMKKFLAETKKVCNVTIKMNGQNYENEKRKKKTDETIEKHTELRKFVWHSMRI